MKKIVYSFVTAVAVVAALVSCSHKENEVAGKTGYEYRFVIAETDTRAALDNEGVTWEVDDQVGVFLGEQSTSANAPVNAEDTPKTITVTSTTEVSKVYAYYPYNEDNADGAKNAEVLFPASQTGGSVSAMPMAGIPTDVTIGGEGGSVNGVIHFVNLGSVIDFRIYSSGDENYSGETVESVTFNATDNKAVSGTATLDLTEVSYDETEKTVTVEMTMAGGEGSSSATVTQQVAVAASKEAATKSLYLVVAPDTYTGTIVVNTNAASYTFSFENREFKRNGLRKYNLNLNNATREAFTKTYTNIGTNELSEGVYLLGAYDNSSNGDGVGTYICWIPNTAVGANTGSTVISHIKYSSSDISSISSDGLENRSADITGSEVEVIKAGDDWLVKVKKTGKYLYYSETGGIGFTTEAANAGHTWEFGTGSNNSKRRFVYPSNFEFYHSGREKGFLYGSNKGAYNFRFYKLSGKSQTISFEGVPENGLTWDLASTDPFVEPNLVGNKTTVSYESSNENIATVNPSTGKVAFGSKTGTVTITATAAAENGYTSATASYTIVVSNSNATPTTYYKASVLEAGYDYIIVYGSNAMKNNEGTLGVEEISVSDNKVSLVNAEALLWTAASGFTLKNGNYYLYRGSNGLRGNSASTNWSYDGAYLWTTASNMGQTTTYYAYYGGGWKSQTTKPDEAILLFNDRQLQNLSFNPTEKTYDLYTGDTFVKPALSGAQTEVTYSSSNTTIATVDDSNGDVSFKGKTGTVTITATAASSAQYQRASASYTISIENSDPNVAKYKKVTSTADLEPGAKYLLVFEGLAGDTDGDGNPKVFSAELNANGTEFLKNKSAALDVTIANGVIKSSDFDDCQFTLEAGYYLKGDQANKYIYPGVSGTSSVMLAESPASHALTIAFNNGIAEIANGGRYLVWSTSSHYFSCNENVSGQYSTGICLYKLDDGRQSQTLTFNYDAFEYDLATSTWTPAEPALSGAQTSPLTWESSNTAVATVNASGTVAPQGKGTATITVSAPASTQYRSATASYELTVVDSTPGATTTYTKVSSTSGIVAGKQYLVVYENGATSKVFKPILSGSTYTASADNAIDAVVSNGTIESDALEDCLVTLEATGSNFFMKAAGSYLYPSNNNLGAENSGTRPLAITISGGKVTIKRSQYNHYLGFETYFLRTGSDTDNLALYAVSDGTTPEPPTPSTYTRISFADGITTGKYLIVNSAETYVFTGVTGNPNAEAVTPASGAISGDFAAYEFTITKSGSNITIQNASDQYLYYVYNSASTASRVAYQSTANGTWTPVSVSTDANGFDLNWQSGSSSQHIYWSDTFFKIGSQQTGVHLYKKNENND